VGYGQADLNKNYTGVNCNEAGWWYFKNGKVDFSYTGLASNAAGVWRIEKGQVNFGYEGIQKYNSKWWYLKNGKINTGYTGAVKGTINNTTGYWRTVNGEINTTYTGLGSIPDGNRMYFSNGTINFSYNGFAKDGNTWYYFRLNGSSPYFAISAAADQNVVILNVGDYVAVKFAEGEAGILSAYSVVKTDAPKNDPALPEAPAA
jgi:hypothetical protein